MQRFLEVSTEYMPSAPPNRTDKVEGGILVLFLGLEFSIAPSSRGNFSADALAYFSADALALFQWINYCNFLTTMIDQLTGYVLVEQFLGLDKVWTSDSQSECKSLS